MNKFVPNQVKSSLESLTIECPDCKDYEDDQYTCTECWCQGGNGKISVLEFLRAHPEVLRNLRIIP